MIVAGVLDIPGAVLSLVRTRAGSDFNEVIKKLYSATGAHPGGEFYT